MPAIQPEDRAPLARKFAQPLLHLDGQRNGSPVENRYAEAFCSKTRSSSPLASSST